MATNENVNKVIYGNQTVMDITDTTAEESDVASGEVFYKANGARSVGTLNKDSAVWGNISGTLSDQTDLQIELNRAYTKTASETSSLDDLDLIPVQKISASSDGRRNIKFRNLKQILKNFFDTVYQTILTLPLSTANGGTGNSTGRVTVGQKSGVTLGDKVTSEGNDTESTGFCSHAEGGYTKATNSYAHADGYYTEANGYASHASGRMTKVTKDHQFAVGILNDPKQDTIFEVGNGKSIGQIRSNAFEVYNDGHINVNGDIYQNGKLYNDKATQGLLKSTVGWTGKNLLENNTIGKTVNGVTFTVNSDGSITANGTATAEVTLWLVGDGWNYSNCKDIPLSIEDNTEYIFGGETDDSSDAYMQLVIKNSDGTNPTYWISYGTKKKVSTSVINRASQKWHCWIRINNGATVTNKTFHPMLRDASITDDTYEPYHESVEEEITQVYADNGVLGAKNLLPNNATSKTVNGVTFTVNDDGSVTANGTATANTFFVIYPNTATNKYKDKIINGCPAGGNANTSYCISVRVGLQSDDTYVRSVDDIGNGAKVPRVNTSTEWLRIYIRIASGYTANNLKFYPMLRLASDPDDTYVPYAMTNRELTEEKLSISELKTIASSATDFAAFKTAIANL